MPIRLLVCCLLVACTGVHVDQVEVAVDHPVVDVDVDANANADVDVQAGYSPAEAVAVRDKPAESVAAPALEIEPKAPSDADMGTADPEQPAVEPEPMVEPCADDDSDGVCNDADICPAGADTDSDSDGYADACEVELWSTRLVMNAPTLVPYSTYNTADPAAIVVEPMDGLECWLEGEGRGWLQIEIPVNASSYDEPLTIRVPRPTASRAGKMADCIEAGLVATTGAYLGDTTGRTWGALSAPSTLPVLNGRHITHFEVTAFTYWTTPANDGHGGTWVQEFDATITARGY
jgi:hypothetical protein